MDEPSGPNENVLKIRRVVAILGILLIVIGQFLVYTIPVKGDQLPPPKAFISFVGLAIFLIKLFHPGKTGSPGKGRSDNHPPVGVMDSCSRCFICFDRLLHAAFL